MRILLVDDAEVLRQTFMRLAAASGHDVVATAADAAETLRLCGNLQPDAVVVDGRLPDGAAELVAQLVRAGVPVLVVASLAERSLVREALAAGARGIVVRPFLRSQLAEALGRLARTP